MSEKHSTTKKHFAEAYIQLLDQALKRAAAFLNEGNPSAAQRHVCVAKAAVNLLKGDRS